MGDGSWMSQPGIFSWDRIDDGSALLARHLPDDLSGAVADFGCGWGYLSREVLARARWASTRLDLIDAEYRALEAARANLAGSARRRSTGSTSPRNRRPRPTTPSSAIRPSTPAAPPTPDSANRSDRRCVAGAPAGRTLLHGGQPWPALRAGCSRPTSPRSRPWPTTTSSGERAVIPSGRGTYPLKALATLG